MEYNFLDQNIYNLLPVESRSFDLKQNIFMFVQFYQGAIAAFFSTGENRAKGIKSVAEALQVLEGEIQGKKFFGGETIGFLDIAVGWIAY